MKILHVINNLGSGGAEKLLEDLVPLIDQSNGTKADVLLLTDDNNVFEDSLVREGVKVDVIKYNNMYDPRNVVEIKKYIIGGEYDIVHSHVFPTQYWVALSRLMLKNKNIKFITTEHSTHNRRRDKPYFKPIDKFIYAQYDTIISITEKTQMNLLDWIDSKGKDIAKHVVIENGVDIEKIRKALPYKKDELIDGINEEIKLICMVGRFSEQKDQATLIKAVSKLSDDVHLLLVGEGPLMNENKKIVEELRLIDRVHFLGFREDIPRILKTVDIVVLSSHWEGFGLAAVEGMAAGKPVIASDVEGLSEVVKGAGLLFEGQKELIITMNSLLNDNVLYKKTAVLCLARAKKYSIQQMVKRLEEVYNKG